MLRCKDVVYLASKQMDTKLSWAKRLQFRFHLWMFKNCAQYMRQIQFLRRTTVKAGDTLFEGGKILHLSNKARQRIRKRLNPNR